MHQHRRLRLPGNVVPANVSIGIRGPLPDMIAPSSLMVFFGGTVRHSEDAFVSFHFRRGEMEMELKKVQCRSGALVCISERGEDSGCGTCCENQKLLFGDHAVCQCN